MPLPRTPSFRLDGRRALVAGGTSGIGLGCAVALAEAGAHVVVAARGEDRLAAVVGEMRSSGLSCEALALDVSDVAALPPAIDRAGPLDIFVNSAGFARHSPSLSTTIDDYDTVMAVNVRGAYFAAREVARSMTSRGAGGSIITISSPMGHAGGMERAVYCASKHAVEGMTKSMAIEWGPHRIRVNTICPTFIRTPLTEPTFADPERVRWLMSRIVLGRVGEVADIMGAVVFLAGDAAALITGTALMVDGGWTAA